MPHSIPHFHLPRAASHTDSQRRKPSPKPASSASTDTLIAPVKQPPCDDAEDKVSVISRSTTVSSSSQMFQTVDALRGVAGDRVRHGRCPPEFLEAIAVREDKQVKIITGLEASTFFVKHLGEQDSDAVGPRSLKKREQESRHLVFAVTAWENGRKCVDYYMSWRNKKKGKQLTEQTITELDGAFRRVSRRIDKDYKAFRRAGSVASSTPSQSSRKRDRSRSPASVKSRPQALPISHPKDEAPLPEGPSEPPASATDSVISLPYLNMIRGVPRGNRLPLFITNPDPLSTLSELDSPVEKPEVSEEAAKLPADGSPLVIAVTPPDTAATITTGPDPERSGLAPIMKSSASIRSTGTRSSKSSRSSQESRQSSPPETPEHKKNDKLPSAEEENSKYQFLIVLLGDKLQKEGISWHGLERQSSTRSQARSFTKERTSPWIGPLARPDANYYHSHRKNKRSGSESDSDGSFDEDGWKDTPVVPLKPLLESMGFVPTGPMHDPSHSNGYHSHSNPVIPMGMPYHAPPPSMVGSPAPSVARQLRYSTYSMSNGTATPYMGGWVPLAGSNAGSPAGSHPPSRAASSLGGYGSPYMHPAY